MDILLINNPNDQLPISDRRVNESLYSRSLRSISWWWLVKRFLNLQYDDRKPARLLPYSKPDLHIAVIQDNSTSPCRPLHLVHR